MVTHGLLEKRRTFLVCTMFSTEAGVMWDTVGDEVDVFTVRDAEVPRSPSHKTVLSEPR